jgi:WD40 repeat protein
MPFDLPSPLKSLIFFAIPMMSRRIWSPSSSFPLKSLIFLVMLGGYSSLGLAEEKPLLVLKGHEGPVTQVCLTPDGKQIISGSSDGTIRFWDFAGKELSRFDTQAKGVTVVIHHPKEKRLFVGNWDGTIQIWDSQKGKRIDILKGHKENITSLALSSDGKKLVSGSGDDSLLVWNLDTGKPVLKIEMDNEYDVTSVLFHPDGKSVFAGDGEGLITQWDISTGESLRTFDGHKRAITDMILSSDGNTLISASQEQHLRFWNVKTGKEMFALNDHRDEIINLALSADGQKFLSVGEDKQIRIWESQKGTCLYSLKFPHRVNHAQFSWDGKQILAAVGNTVGLWNIPKKEPK